MARSMLGGTVFYWRWQLGKNESLGQHREYYFYTGYIVPRKVYYNSGLKVGFIYIGICNSICGSVL